MPEFVSSAKTLWAIDMDFTTLDSERVFDGLSRLLERAGVVGVADLYAARKEVEATGGTFDVMGYLSHQLGVPDQDLDAISEEFAANETGERYLYDDAPALLRAIRDKGDPLAILTYGSERTQMLKLRASGLIDYPFLITDTKAKGDLIQGWRQANGSYRLVTGAGELMIGSVGVLVDDKSSSFDNLPNDWHGYRVWRGQPRLSQRGEVPARVATVNNLMPIIQSLRAG